MSKWSGTMIDQLVIGASAVGTETAGDLEPPAVRRTRCEASCPGRSQRLPHTRGPPARRTQHAGPGFKTSAEGDNPAVGLIAHGFTFLISARARQTISLSTVRNL